MQVCVRAFNQTLQKSHLWLKDLSEIANFNDEEEAYSSLRAVLHSLRDRLPVDETAHLAAQLPMLIRGMFYEGWKPSSVPDKIRSEENFIKNVKNSLGNAQNPTDPEIATRAVFKLLCSHISEGEINHIKSALPKHILPLWP